MRRSALLLSLFLFLTAASVFAHEPGLSSVRLVATPEGIDATFTIDYEDFRTLDAELDSAGSGPINGADFLRLRERIAKVADHTLTLTVDSGKTLVPELPPQVDLIENDNIQARLRFSAAAPGETLVISSPLVPELPQGHQEFVELADTDGKILGEGFLTASSNRLAFTLPADLASAVAPRAFRSDEFFDLGVIHLLGGDAHLLFLAGLLLGCRTMRKAVEILAIFTIAHLVSLTLVTLDIIRLSGDLVGPAIALSLVYVGIENLFCGKSDLSWRGVLTFVFGLTHGMAFAAVFNDLGGGTSQQLAFFALGLEATQFTFAALVFAMLLILRKRPALPRVIVPIVSALIAVVGLVLLIERALLIGK